MKTFSIFEHARIVLLVKSILVECYLYDTSFILCLLNDFILFYYFVLMLLLLLLALFYYSILTSLFSPSDLLP